MMVVATDKQNSNVHAISDLEIYISSTSICMGRIYAVCVKVVVGSLKITLQMAKIV